MLDFSNHRIFSKTISFLSVTILLCSCSKLHLSKMHYDPGAGCYVYHKQNKNVALRFDDGRLVSRQDSSTFIDSLEMYRFRYHFAWFIEYDDLLSIDDYRLAEIYSIAQQKLLTGEWEYARAALWQMETIYPKATWYSDFYFLKAYSYEAGGQNDLAFDNYQKFQAYSSQKLTGFIRNYSNDISLRSTFAIEKKIVSGNIIFDSIKATSIIKPIVPKYYFPDFHPGFTINKEGFSGKMRPEPMVFFGLTDNRKFLLGAGCYFPGRKRIDYLLFGDAAIELVDLGFAMPITLYTNSHSRFSLKIVPSVTLTYFRNRKMNGEDNNIDKGYSNGAMQFSTGYFINQRISLGAMCRIYLIDEWTHGKTEAWRNNVAEFSMFYHVTKKLSLKSGIYNQHPVMGLFVQGSSFLYDFKAKTILLTYDLY